MNYRIITSAVLALSLSSFAGQAYFIFKKDSTYTAGLLGIDSLNFPKDRRGETDSLFIAGYGLKAFDRVPLANTEVSFKTDYYDAEKLSVNVQSGPRVGSFLFYLRDVEYIDFVKMNSKSDTDGDGLSDVDEMYKIGTNPRMTDTDGDGYNDGTEMNLFNPQNPTVWNPNVADLPKLEVTMTMTPSVTLTRTTSTGITKSTTISEGEAVQTTTGVSNSETRTASLMHAWSVGIQGGYASSSPTFMVNVGYNGSYTTSTGHTMTESQSSSITRNYNQAITEAMTQGESITGGTISMQARITNTGKVAFTIGNLLLNASTYTPSGDIQIIAELAVGDGAGEDKWTNITLAPGESKDLQFWKGGLPLDALTNLVFNPGAIFLSASAFKITTEYDGRTSDFTEAYTKASASTARITIDNGVYYGNSTDRVREYRVSTNFRYNETYSGKDDFHKPVSLSEILNILKVPFQQDSLKVGDEVRYGLKSLGDLSYATADGDTACWFVSIEKASDPTVAIVRSLQIGSFNMDSVIVGAGDQVQFMYNEDRDHDHVPASMENMLGISDEKVDSDGDQLSDFDEINGWTKIAYTYDSVSVPMLRAGVCETTDTMMVKVDSKHKYCFVYHHQGAKYDISVPCREVELSSIGAQCYRPYTIKFIKPENVRGYDTVAVVVDSAEVGPFFTNPALKDTDGDGLEDNVDPNPNVREVSTKSNIAKIAVHDISEGKDVAVARSCRMEGLLCVDSLFVTDSIRGANVTVNVTTVEPVKVNGGMNVYSGNTRVPVTAEGIKGSGADAVAMVFKFSVANLSAASADTLKMVVYSEKGDSTTYHLVLRSLITAPTDLVLGRNSDRNAIILNWVANKTDPRILGYVVLRAEGGRNYNNPSLTKYFMEPTTVKPQDGYALSNGITLVKVLGPGEETFTDKVGGGSPYYTYRVYAYAKAGNTYVFSNGSNVATRSVGRIKFQFQMTGRGTEYLWHYSKAHREDFVTDAIFYEGTNTRNAPIHQYTYYFYEGGSVGAGNTIIYEEWTDRDMNHDDNSVPGDHTTYSYEMGSQGITLQLKAAGKDYDIRPNHSIFWPYENFAKVLKGSSEVTPNAKDKSVPKRDFVEHKFNYGDRGIEFDPGNNGCDKDCGSEPHAGYKFKFDYKWVDD